LLVNTIVVGWGALLLGWWPLLLLLLLHLLLQLLGSRLILEDALVHISAAVALAFLVVHDHVRILVPDHLDLLASRSLVLHHHARRMVTWAVQLLTNRELLRALVASHGGGSSRRP